MHNCLPSIFRLVLISKKAVTNLWGKKWELGYLNEPCIVGQCIPEMKSIQIFFPVSSGISFISHFTCVYFYFFLIYLYHTFSESDFGFCSPLACFACPCTFPEEITCMKKTNMIKHFTFPIIRVSIKQRTLPF